MGILQPNVVKLASKLKLNLASMFCTHVVQLLSKQHFRIQEASGVVYETLLQFSWGFSHICLSGRKIWNQPLDNSSAGGTTTSDNSRKKH